MSSSKSGQFWELQAWMADNDVTFRELEILTGFGKNVLHRLVCGHFVRVDPRLPRKIKDVTKGRVGETAWAAFFTRRLAERTEAA